MKVDNIKEYFENEQYEKTWGTAKAGSTKRLTPSDSVFYKEYLMNLLAPKGKVYENLYGAMQQDPIIFNIVNKMTDYQVQTIIERIEAKQ